MTGNLSFWLKIYVCCRSFISLREELLCQEFMLMIPNASPCHESHHCDMRNFLGTWNVLTGNLFLWQEYNPCDRNYILVKGIVFMWHKRISCERNLFVSWSRFIFAGVPTKNFLWGFKILCQSGCQFDLDYPTLDCPEKVSSFTHLWNFDWI